MTDQYIGEIRLFAGAYAPVGWAVCAGQLVPVAQNTALFAVLSTRYGGDGKTTFALPDLRGAFPVGQGQGPGLAPYEVGHRGGAETVTLTQAELPPHRHDLAVVDAAGTQNSPANAVWARARYGRVQDLQYTGAGAVVPMAPTALHPAGGSQPHNNMPPFLALTFIIAMTGEFPVRS